MRQLIRKEVKVHKASSDGKWKGGEVSIKSKMLRTLVGKRVILTISLK